MLVTKQKIYFAYFQGKRVLKTFQIIGTINALVNSMNETTKTEGGMKKEYRVKHVVNVGGNLLYMFFDNEMSAREAAARYGIRAERRVMKANGIGYEWQTLVG